MFRRSLRIIYFFDAIKQPHEASAVEYIEDKVKVIPNMTGPISVFNETDVQLCI